MLHNSSLRNYQLYVIQLSLVTATIKNSSPMQHEYAKYLIQSAVCH